MGSIPELSVLKGTVTRFQNSDASEIFLPRLFELNAYNPAHAEKTAIIYCNEDTKKEVSIKYRDLESAANRLARAILRAIQKKGGRCNNDGDCLIAVSIPPSDALILTLLAIWKAGAAYLPLDVQAPANRIQHILEEAKPILVISHRSVGNKDDAFKKCNVVNYSYLEKKSEKYSQKVVQNGEKLKTATSPSIAIVLYTSGSTGIPKGVRIPHKAVYNRLQWQWNTFPYSESENVCVFKTALTFVDAVSEVWGPLLGSSPKSLLVIPKEITKDPERLIPKLEEYKVERLVLVPSLLRAILLYLEIDSKATPKPLQNLKLWVCSGEPLVPSLVAHFFNHFKDSGHKICNFYGSTEVMGDITYHKLTDPKCETVPIGLPIDNSIVYLLDRKLNPVSNGNTGEIYCAGHNLAVGYVNNRDRDRFISNPHTVEMEYATLYRTGDYGKIVNGVLVYEGRTDSQVKVRGHRVDLSEIENSLHNINNVDKVSVLCYKPGEIDQSIIAFVTVKDSALKSSEIEEELKRTLPPYSMPQVIILDSIPLLNNGKVDRQFLLKQFEEGIEGKKEGQQFQIDYSNIPPENMKAARCLFETVASVIGPGLKATIDKNVNFYELGGNSLNSIYTITKLRDQGFVVGITEFISSKTLGDVLLKIRSEDTDANAANDVNNNTDENKYVAQMLQDKHKNEVVEMIADSFYEKADLEQRIEPRIEREAYIELLDVLWEPLLQKDLSFAVQSKETGELVGVSLNFDAHDEPPVEITSRLNIIFEFLEFLEGPIRDNQLPHGKGKVLHGFMMGTHKNLSAQENIEIIQFMEAEELKLAKKRQFVGIFTSNSSPLTQQLGTDIFHYKVMLNYQVNQYVASDGSKPFEKAPDDQVVTCSWKEV